MNKLPPFIMAVISVFCIGAGSGGSSDDDNQDNTGRKNSNYFDLSQSFFLLTRLLRIVRVNCLL